MLDLQEASARVRAKIGPEPLHLGIVLGSGLGAFADQLDGSIRIPYVDIPHMPTPSVPGHSGQLVVGRLGNLKLGCLQGRIHLYEGYSPERVVFGARLLAELGCAAVFLTNAAGGIRDGLRAGKLMLVTDHINLTGCNPLIGADLAGASPFVDLSDAYDAELVTLAHEAAKESGIELDSGVYAGLLGPTYETPAEVRMLRRLGADAVGMSTVNEVIALRQRGVRVGALSCITNVAAGISQEKLTHEEVKQTAARVQDLFVALLARWVQLCGQSIGANPQQNPSK